MQKPTKRKILFGAIFAVAMAVMVVVAFFVYTGIYYHADQPAVAEYLETQPTVTRSEIGEDVWVFSAPNPQAGIIFYPGGKVEAIAYAPLCTALAAKGYLCILVGMPYNLAVLKPSAADGLQAQYPEIADWYIGGHSLGGSMAAQYLAKHADEYRGLFLLGAYSATDLSGTSVPVLSVYGTEDKVLNAAKYRDSLDYYPNLREEIIQGGCHSYFGIYGAQEGDGQPTIGNVEQIEYAAGVIHSFIADTLGK